jgi:methionyl-tRNA synthetase
MSEKPRYYITTAIAYPNGPPHIGYGYEVITTDAIARFKRLDGYDVFFLTGTDEHGSKIAQTAGRDGITPQQLVDKNQRASRRWPSSSTPRTTSSSAPPSRAITNRRRCSGSG